VDRPAQREPRGGAGRDPAPAARCPELPLGTSTWAPGVPRLAEPSPSPALGPPPRTNALLGRLGRFLASLQFSLSQLTSGSPPKQFLRPPPVFKGSDLPHGECVYSMLIVFRGERAACLKHSSLFKVNDGTRALPLPCRSGYGRGVFLPVLNLRLSEESKVSARACWVVDASPASEPAGPPSSRVTVARPIAEGGSQTDPDLF